MREIDTLRNVDMAQRKSDDSITKKFIMIAPLLPPRTDRGSPLRPVAAAPRGSAAGDDLTAEQQAELAAQHAAFDYDVAEKAEILREHEALESLMQEQLKNDDEIMKKWIALI
jgi:hypothetical protein